MRIKILLLIIGSLLSATQLALAHSGSDRYVYLDRSGNHVVSILAGYTPQDFQDGMACVRKSSDNYSYINRAGDLINCSFRAANRFSENLAAVASRDLKFGFIDRSGHYAIAPSFDDTLCFSEGLALVRVGSKFGFVNTKGEMVIKPEFESAANFSEHRAAAMHHDKIGFIDKSGNWVIEPKYDYVSGFSDGCSLAIETNKHMCFIDSDGKEFLELDLLRNQSEYLGLDILGGFSQLQHEIALTHKDRLVLHHVPGTTPASPSIFREGLAAMPLDGKYGYIDKTGNYVISPRFEYAFPFTGERALVKQNGKFGYIDRKGNLVIEPKFKFASGFSEGLAAVAEERNNWEYIDTNGRVVLSANFCSAAPFSEGLARVSICRRKCPDFGFR